MGGLAFSIVFMATDPVSASQTKLGNGFYGFNLIGFLTVIIRVTIQLSRRILCLAVCFMNVFRSAIEYYVV